MGGIKSGQYNVAWTGGTPNVDWNKGLLQPNPRHIGQFQRRYESGRAATSGYERRRCALPNQLDGIEQLAQFKLDVTAHLHEHGMDSIAHVPDPHDQDQMVHIIDGAGKFTATSCENAMEDQLAKYDDYDHENDLAAVVFLLGSLSAERSESVRHRCNKDGVSPYAPISNTFPVVWLQMLQDIAPVSYKKYQQLAEQLKQLTPSTYPGVSITMPVKDWYRIADPLSLTGHYQPNYTLYLITAAL